MKKCILTGLGGQGRAWVKRLQARDDVEIVAYVEPMEANRERAIKELSVPGERIHGSFDQALNAGGADFVMDVTPPSVHHEIAYKAFEAGLDLLGEKPLSDNFETARQVVEAGEKAGRTHMITQNYRFSSQPRTTRRLIGEGLIGQPGQCDVRFYMPWADLPGTHYVTQPYMLINDMMVHHFDMMRSVLGEDPESVQAITWNQPWGWHQGDAAHAIVFEYASGLRATHVSVGCAIGSRTHWNGDWRVEGDKGSLEWTRDGGVTYAHLHRVETPEERKVELDSVPPADRAIVDEFFAAIDAKRAPECSARDNLGSLAMVFGAIKSAKEGRRVQLSELGT